MKNLGRYTPMSFELGVDIDQFANEKCTDSYPISSLKYIYGKNNSGKSTLLKQIGITVILAQAGCFVPAESVLFTPFRYLLGKLFNFESIQDSLGETE